MKLSKMLILVLALLLSQFSTAQTTRAADRSWKPFFAAFRAAVKKRDREALSKMMVREFYYLSSGGDENGNNDSRDEAFEYWEIAGVGAWEALDTVPAQGTVANTAMREPGALVRAVLLRRSLIVGERSRIAASSDKSRDSRKLKTVRLFSDTISNHNIQ